MIKIIQMGNEEWDDFKNAKKFLGDLYVFLEKQNEIMHGDNGVSALLNHYLDHMKLFEKTLEVLSDFIETETELNNKAIDLTIGPNFPLLYLFSVLSSP